MLRKSLSILLSTILFLSLFITSPINVSAADSDVREVGAIVDSEKTGARIESEKVGTQAVKTQNETVEWLNNQDGNSYDFGNFYDSDGHYWGGTQCVEFVRAYVNWLVNGDAGSDAWGRATGNGDSIWANSLWSELGWNVYQNTPDFMPEPGDIFSSGTNGIGHTGVVISSDLYSARIADSNARNNNPYDGDPVWVHPITWGASTAYTARYYIRPYFKDPVPQGHVMSESEGAGRTIPDGDYWIQSNIANHYCLDIPGNDFDTQNGKNVQMWKWSNDLPIYDVFHFEYQNNGFYRIYQYNTNMCLQVEGSSLYCGTNVHMWGYHESLGQYWSVEKTDGGYYLRSRCNSYYLDVTSGAFEDGTNVLTWEWNEGNKQKWNLIKKGHIMSESEGAGRTIPDGDYWIQSNIANHYCLDIPGNDFDTQNGKNVQMWQWGNDIPIYDLYHFEYQNNGYYRITQHNTNMCLQVESSSLEQGINVHMWETHDSLGQLWSIEKANNGYKIRAKCNGYFLDVFNGLHSNGTNVLTWEETGADNQIWSFIPYNTEITYIGDVNDDKIVNISDVTAIQRHLSESELFNNRQLALADTNGDGVVDINDATHLQMYLAEYDIQLG